MADLASQPGRRTAQRRITNNRDGVLPNRRDTNAPAVAIRADMRAATRGDGGAAELTQTLDRFFGAIEGAARAKAASDQEVFRQEAAEGMQDAALGQEADPAKARSLAYLDAFYRERTESRFNEFSFAVKGEVDQALNDGGDPDAVGSLFVERMRGFLDEEVNSLPAEATTARLESASRLSTLGQQLEMSINERVRERTQQEFVTTTQGNIRTALQDDQPLDFEGYVEKFRSGNIAPADAKARAVEAVMAVALDRDNPRPELLDSLLGSTQADGKTPSLNAAEHMQVLDRISQARSLQEQREKNLREDRRDALMDAWLPRVLDGEIVDDEIMAAGRDGTLEAQEVVQYIGLTESLRNAPTEGHEDADFVLQVAQRAAMGNPPSNATILSWASQGRFGTGRAGQRAAIRFLQDNTSASRSAGARTDAASGISSRQERTRNISTARSFMWDQTKPEAPSRYQGEMLVLQDREFNRRVRGGEDPLDVAQSLVTRNRDVILRDRRPAPQRLPDGNRAVAAGSYVWSPD